MEAEGNEEEAREKEEKQKQFRCIAAARYFHWRRLRSIFQRRFHPRERIFSREATGVSPKRATWLAVALPFKPCAGPAERDARTGEC